MKNKNMDIELISELIGLDKRNRKILNLSTVN